jgi:uncharacterized protein YciI
MPVRLFALLLVAAALTFSARSLAQGGGDPALQPGPSAEKTDERKLFALLLRPGPAWKPSRPFAEQGLRPHFDYWMALFKAGRVATAGPLGSDSGLVLLFAGGQEDAEAIMRADPAIAAGIFTGDVRPYAPPMINADVLGGD